MVMNKLGISSHAKGSKVLTQMHLGRDRAQPFTSKAKDLHTFLKPTPQSRSAQRTPKCLPHQQGRDFAGPDVGGVVSQGGHGPMQRPFRHPPVWDENPEDSTTYSSSDRRVATMGPEPMYIANVASRGGYTDLPERHGSQASIVEDPLADDQLPRNASRRSSTAHESAAENFANLVSMTDRKRDIRSAPNPRYRPFSASSQNVHNHDPLDTHVRNQLQQTQEFRKDAEQFHEELMVRLEKQEQSLQGIKDTAESLWKGQIGVLQRVDEILQEQHVSERRLREVIDDLADILKSTIRAIDKMASSDETRRRQDAKRYNELLSAVDTCRKSIEGRIGGVQEGLDTITFRQQEHREESRLKYQRIRQEADEPRVEQQHANGSREGMFALIGSDPIVSVARDGGDTSSGSSRRQRQQGAATRASLNVVAQANRPSHANRIDPAEDSPRKDPSPECFDTGRSSTEGGSVYARQSEAWNGEDGDEQASDEENALRMQPKANQHTFPIRPIDDEDLPVPLSRSSDLQSPVQKVSRPAGKSAAPKKYGRNAQKRAASTTQVEAQIEEAISAASRLNIRTQDTGSSAVSRERRLEMFGEAYDMVNEGLRATDRALSPQSEPVNSRTRKGRMAAKAPRRRRRDDSDSDEDSGPVRVAKKRATKTKPAATPVEHRYPTRIRGIAAPLPSDFPFKK